MTPAPSVDFRGQAAAGWNARPRLPPRKTFRSRGPVSWLPDPPTPGPSRRANLIDPSRQWLVPLSSPVTVAGAAPVSHRLPVHPRVVFSRAFLLSSARRPEGCHEHPLVAPQFVHLWQAPERTMIE